MNGIQLYIQLLATSIRAQLQYRASFVLSASGQFLTTGVEFLGIWALFARFDQLQGWTLPEIALFYSTLSVAFALGDALGTGFDRMGAMVRGGDFDRVLVRPRATILQIMGKELALRRVGRLLQGLIVLGIAIYLLDIAWSPALVGLLLLTIAGGVCMFLGLFILQGTLTFWTIESVEAVNAFSYGGMTAGQYPITIYADWFRRLFTFIVPLACVSYFPLTLVLGRADILGVPAPLRAAAPLAGVLFLMITMGVWQLGVQRYQSTGH